MPDLAHFTQSLAQEGFALVPSAISPETLADLCTALAEPLHDDDRRRGGQRDVLDRVPEVQSLASSEPVRRLAEAVLGSGCFTVRALFFDKTPRANWKVPWHQDLTIAVRERREVAGFGPWTTKAGATHCHAPRELLERMLSLRIHLDDCAADNGPLRVIAGSHRAGILSATQIDALKTRPESVCTAQRGEVLAFHPLLLHASSPAVRPGHRRVLHLELASASLPEGLSWRWQHA
ncbi:phytanoyl-CoA dioxygenase family protein [Aggregicoccus sp. 17bor-14]|uniref:phytanoyl-CoA dioxygenase family protein n=1 Tax=Myxococcaceae TaxID=31 RepID=UPI00129C88FA|nr:MULTISPECIES: phytanoyl-CoA dioxygenase family protein [Myxococcaceae]MBF5042162.1 phytanoyl-CoA dioxygenase family protein [Simulacricoccus sp. 17bor-14]MRI87939.1 phytanoyl-CoA dioxygenase family protein [Aggregicoccus sp. 17bor-14]